MKLSLLKHKLIDYHRNKGWGKKSLIIPDHDEIVWLDMYLKTFNNDPNCTEDLNILFEDFKKFVERNSTKKGLLSSDYLNSDSLSAILFREWKKTNDQTLPIKFTPVEIKYNLPSLLSLVPIQLDFDISKQLDFIPNNSQPNLNIANSFYADLQPKINSLSLFCTLSPFLKNIDSERIFANENIFKSNDRLKEVSDYHTGTLFLLGQQLLLRIKLFTLSQLNSSLFQLICIEMGKVFINFITQRTKEIPKNILNSLKLQIERQISSTPQTSSLFDKHTPEISDESAVNYIQNKINQNPIEPFAILLYAAEVIESTGIADTLDYLTNEFFLRKTGGKEIALMIIRRLNQADDMLHTAVPQNANQLHRP